MWGLFQRGQLPFHNALNAGALPEVVNVTLEVSPNCGMPEEPPSTPITKHAL